MFLMNTSIPAFLKYRPQLQRLLCLVRPDRSGIPLAPGRCPVAGPGVLAAELAHRDPWMVDSIFLYRILRPFPYPSQLSRFALSPDALFLFPQLA